MQAAPARYVSVSELYSTDEVELLLDEIRELEPTSCRGEDIQDFEIAGSGAGGAAGGRSPVGTERSWDSHAHYRRPPPPPPRPLAPLYCRLAHLATLPGAFTLLIVLCSAGTCGCLWAAVGLRPWLLPLASRVRLLLLGGFSSLMLHTVLLLMHITRLAALLPIDWNKLAMWTSAWSGASLLGGAALTLHALLAEPAYRWAPPHLARLLYCASGLGLSGACASFVIVYAAVRACRAAGGGCAGGARAGGGAGGGGGGAGAGVGARSASTGRSSSVSLRTTYRAVPSAPPPHHHHHHHHHHHQHHQHHQPQPSTSRDNPL